MYKYKYTFDSAFSKFKAHIVTKDFKQGQGIDVDEIISPVLKMTMLPMMLAFVGKNDLDLFQMDVKIAFLHGHIDEGCI